MSEWADIVLTLSGFILAIPLIPTILNEDSQVPRTTSIPTGTALAIVGATYVVIGFWLAASTSFAQVILWYFIAWKRPVQ